MARPAGPTAPVAASATPRWLSAGSEALATPVEILPAPCACASPTPTQAGAFASGSLEPSRVLIAPVRLRPALPLAFSQGHRPGARLRFPDPGLPVGAESDCEAVA
ncbi:MAG: hypothetical protein U0802_15950 [Candidatus Binatia bacterium]